MPQLSKLQRRRQIKRGVIDVTIIKGEETLVVDQRSQYSMATFVQEKLNRLQNSAIQGFSQQASAKN